MTGETAYGDGRKLAPRADGKLMPHRHCRRLELAARLAGIEAIVGAVIGAGPTAPHGG
jgi:hypothetical protein